MKSKRFGMVLSREEKYLLGELAYHFRVSAAELIRTWIRQAATDLEIEYKRKEE